MKRLRGKKGMTLVELIAACAITVVVIGAVCGALYFGMHSFAAGSADLANHQSANLLEEYLLHSLATAASADFGAENTAAFRMHFASDGILVLDEDDDQLNRIGGVQSVTLKSSAVGAGNSARQKLDYTILATGLDGRALRLAGGVVMMNAVAPLNLDETLESTNTTDFFNIVPPAPAAPAP